MSTLIQKALPATSSYISLSAGDDHALVEEFKTLYPIDVNIGKVRFFGAYADVYEGHAELSGECEGRKVAVKRLRVHIQEDEAFAKALAGEIRAWVRLRHENVVSLLGTMLLDSVPSLVSEWMENGTVVTYLKAHKDADRLALAKGIALGLEHIHSQGVVHSDLKGDNVLVDAHGAPKISDFGISRVVVNSLTIAGTTTLKGNTRWMAIELIDARVLSEPSAHELHTKETDAWAFGMVLYEVLSGKVPYYHVKTDGRVMFEITSGKIPEKPAHIALVCSQWEKLWSICVQCWMRNPKHRPTMSAIVKHLASDSLDSFSRDVLRVLDGIVNEESSIPNESTQSRSASLTELPTSLFNPITSRLGEDWDTLARLRAETVGLMGEERYLQDRLGDLTAKVALHRNDLDAINFDFEMQYLADKARQFVNRKKRVDKELKERGIEEIESKEERSWSR